MRPQSNFSKRPKSKKQSSTSAGEIRIIGGKFKGRKLKVHDKEGLRPTTDRLKETVFNWLMLDVRGATVLDCFAGAGSLGFEAISRGAESLTCIEKDKQAANQLKANCAVLKADTQISVLQGDFFAKTQQLSEPFDLVFIDPPFHKGMAEKTIESLFNQNLISTDSIVYLEQEANSDFSIDTSEFAEKFDMLKEKKAGQVLAQLYRVV